MRKILRSGITPGEAVRNLTKHLEALERPSENASPEVEEELTVGQDKVTLLRSKKKFFFESPKKFFFLKMLLEQRFTSKKLFKTARLFFSYFQFFAVTNTFAQQKKSFVLGPSWKSDCFLESFQSLVSRKREEALSINFFLFDLATKAVILQLSDAVLLVCFVVCLLCKKEIVVQKETLSKKKKKSFFGGDFFDTQV